MVLGVRRFNDFHERLGVSTALLTARLNLLIEHGIVARVAAERPGDCTRHHYRFTAKGRHPYPILTALRQWREQYELDDAGAPVHILHRDCGAPVGVEIRCAADHRLTSTKPSPYPDREHAPALPQPPHRPDYPAHLGKGFSAEA